MKIIYTDEVGYGAIFSSVLACAVAADEEHIKIDGVKDSKKLTKKRRQELYPIISNQVEFAFGTASPNKIEKMNIHYARYEAMRIAAQKLLDAGVKAEKVIVDGKFTIPNFYFNQEAVIKADDKFWQMSAASILAKVKRDDIISKLSEMEKYSHYDLNNNNGYYTPKHRLGIIKYGPTSLHRRNFDYFKYSLHCHNKYKSFIKKGGDLESYLNYEKECEIRYRCSYYLYWKKYLRSFKK